MMNKALLKLDLKLLRKPILITTPITSIIILALWLFMHLSAEEIVIDTFHVDYAFSLIYIIGPVTIFTSTFLGLFLYKKYYNTGINELLYTQEISPFSHFVTHIISLLITVLINFGLSTITLFILSFSLGTFTPMLILLQICYLVGMICAVFISYILTILLTNDASPFYNYIIPTIIYLHILASVVLAGANFKLMNIINKVVGYVNFYGFLEIDLFTSNISEMVKINILHLILLPIIVVVLLSVSFLRFKKKEMI